MSNTCRSAAPSATRQATKDAWESYELLVVDEAVRGAIRENRQVDAIRDAARS